MYYHYPPSAEVRPQEHTVKNKAPLSLLLCHSAYADLATLALLARHTGGSVQHFPAFSDVAAGAPPLPPPARARCSALIPPAAERSREFEIALLPRPPVNRSVLFFCALFSERCFQHVKWALTACNHE